eukprot:1247928-Pyramimonas_sp.AAC.1
MLDPSGATLGPPGPSSSRLGASRSRSVAPLRPVLGLSALRGAPGTISEATVLPCALEARALGPRASCAGIYTHTMLHWRCAPCTLVL